MLEILSQQIHSSKGADDSITSDQAIDMIQYIKRVLNMVAGDIMKNKSTIKHYKIGDLQSILSNYHKPGNEN